LNDIRSVMLTRSRAAELCSTKFFEEYAKGMWVRVSVGFSRDDPKREVKYRVGEITSKWTLIPFASYDATYPSANHPSRCRSAQEVLRSRRTSN
jgi:hypothetical protein